MMPSEPLHRLAAPASFVLVRAAVREYYLLRQKLSAIPSLLGRISKEPTFETQQRENGAGDAIVRFCDLARLMADLTPEQYSVLILHSCSTDGSEAYLRAVPRYELQPLDVPIGDLGGICGALLVNGWTCRRPRDAGYPRCKRHYDPKQAQRPVTFVTKGGEEYVSESDQADGMAIVRGLRARPMTRLQIAEALGISQRQVASRLAEAYDLVILAIEQIDAIDLEAQYVARRPEHTR